MIVCAGKMEKFGFARAVGVGMIDSAIGLSKICEREAVDSIVFIGSAGSYDRDIKIGEIIISDSATQIELGFVNKQSYTPIENHISSGVFGNKDDKQNNTFDLVSYETNIQNGEIKYKRGIINSSNYITTDKSISAKIARANIVAENMEFFSIMSVAKYYVVPCFGIFCITNYCDEFAHRDFLANIDMAKSKLKEHLDDNLWIRTYGRNGKFEKQGNNWVDKIER